MPFRTLDVTAAYSIFKYGTKTKPDFFVIEKIGCSLYVNLKERRLQHIRSNSFRDSRVKK